MVITAPHIRWAANPELPAGMTAETACDLYWDAVHSRIEAASSFAGYDDDGDELPSQQGYLRAAVNELHGSCEYHQRALQLVSEIADAEWEEMEEEFASEFNSLLVNHQRGILPGGELVALSKAPRVSEKASILHRIELRMTDIYEMIEEIADALIGQTTMGCAPVGSPEKLAERATIYRGRIRECVLAIEKDCHHII